eukprot:Nitzschia sp. Nitz4//scaffold383_size13514//5188//9241//NITZ4_008976-RA/size13514-augustus-gene-0.1-mRNA-1//1//CDS//3329549939//9364//frame0
MNHTSIPDLLKKTEHYDKDERYMATSDLCEVLKRTAESQSTSVASRLDASTERRICKAVLRLLHDKSNDVQAIAVKTLGVLLTTVKEEQVLEIADSLADQVLDASKSELRDVYAIGLRTLVKTIPSSMGDPTSQRLVGRLLDGIRTASEEIVLACLDILADLLVRFGGTAYSVRRQHEPILQMCLVQVTSADPVLRKRAGNTLGCLSVVLSDHLLVSMVDRLLNMLESSTDTQALLRTMCMVAGAVGQRLQQPQIDRIIPIFLKYTNPEEAVTGDDDDVDDFDGDHPASASDDDFDMRDESAVARANELRESCFMGFESFLLKCPTQVQPHLDKIVQASLAFASYDPNYSYGNDDEEDAIEEDDEEYDDDEYEDDDDDEEDDDDDESWKVRRAAIRALKSVVECQRHDPSSLWTQEFPTRKGQSAVVAAALVGRFKEREENCRVDVMDCFTRLLAVTVQASSAGVVAIQDSSSSTDSMVPSIDLGSQYAPSIVKACIKLLSVKKGGERSKSQAMSLLCALCRAPGGVGGLSEIMAVFAHVQPFLSTGGDAGVAREASSKTLQLDALSLVLAMLTNQNHDPIHVRKGIHELLLPQLCAAVQEQWYKVISEALRALAAVPHFFVVGYSTETDSQKTSELQGVAQQIYTAIEPLLAAHDVDQEIKECALAASATLLKYLHTYLTPEQAPRLLTLLLDRLKNESTRIASIKTISIIAAAPDTIDQEKLSLEPILSECIETMAHFLKLQSRSLKQSSLEALDIVVTHHGIPESNELYNMLPEELSSLVVHTDLHIAHLALRVAISALKVCPACGGAVKQFVLPAAMDLSVSPLLQELALESLLALLEQLVVSGAVEFEALLGMLRGNLEKASSSKHAMENLAKCIAVIAAVTSAENRTRVVTETLASLEGCVTPENKPGLRAIQLALLMSGDLGRRVDLGTAVEGGADKFLAVYTGYFDSPSDDLKNAAAYALGRAAVGTQSVFLPIIVDSLKDANQKKQYLLLSALRGFIQSSYQHSGGEGVASTIPVILPHLQNHFSDAEESVRTMVAECLGSLTCMQPQLMLEKLAGLVEKHVAVEAPNGTVDPADTTSKKNAYVCWTIATSIKLAIAGKVDSTQMMAQMPTLLKLLEVKELSARNASLLMVYSAVHHMPQVVVGLLKDQIIPTLYEVAGFKLERKVDLGPFTHKVDDALPLRKATFSIFATCLENMPGNLDIAAFMPVLAKALGDVEDVQLQAHQIVIAMCSRQPADLVASAELFVEPLEKTVNKKAGQKTGTELERLQEWIKSGLRATVALHKVEGVMNNRKFADHYERVRNNAKYTAMLEAIAEER